MRVLGLSTGEDCGAAVVRERRIVAAVNEERLCREKMVKGYPGGSVDTVLELSGMDPGTIDAVAVGGENGFFVEGLQPQRSWLSWDHDAGIGARVKRWAGRLSRLRGKLPLVEKAYYLLQEPSYRERRRRVRDAVRRQLGREVPVRFVDHHLCHAASAYHTCGFDPALVISLDGGGDGRSGLVLRGEGGRLEPLHGVSAYDSLGNWYAYVTHLCGFRAHRHEGKITGLAAHGEPRYTSLLAEMVGHEEGTFVNRSGLVFREAIRALEERLPRGWRREDLAASVQAHFEREVRAFVRHWIRRTGLGRLALAGGVFANVRINQEILELPETESVFIHPAMSDAGLGAGAALALTEREAPDEVRAAPVGPLPHVYLGPEPGEAEVERALEARGLDGELAGATPGTGDEALAEAVAARLAEGRVVAVTRGPMEYGPRALGNRSILYQPTDPTIQDWLNEKLDRTEFMPFAPAVLWEARHRCFRGLDGAEHAAQFMTIAVDSTRWMRQRMPGVVHVDGTVRPQLVRREVNPFLHAVLRAYERRTGLPGVVNTSFNRHGEPIVCGAEDALKSFLESELDDLVLGDRLVARPGIEARVRPAAG